MDIKDVSKLYELNKNDGVIFSYHGIFLQKMIEDISVTIDKQISSYTGLKSDSRCLTLFIELSQNILRYSAKSSTNSKGNQLSKGTILVGSKSESIFIISGNKVTEDQSKLLKSRLDELKCCSKDELNKLFKKQLNNKNNISGKGAGLGLIDIMRKSDNVEYYFSKLDSGETFFSIKVEYKS